MTTIEIIEEAQNSGVRLSLYAVYVIVAYDRG